jgi:outer membrane protein OmpA-like peptidoglycan-associated protein
MILENVTFGPGKTTLSNTSSNSDLKNLLLALNSNPDIKVQISGHTDKSGNEANNKTLSKKRAAYVYNYLIDKGISADRLTYKGYGSSYPAYSNRTKDGRAANRRIEIKIISKKAESMDKLVDEESIKKVEVLAEEEEVTIDEITSKKVGDAIVFQNVIFAPGDTTIADSVAIELDKLVKILKENPEMKIAVIGYTDISGIPEKNIYLSNVRAKAVHDYILLNDIEFNRLSYLGKGSAKPIAPNAYRWGRDKNRRIEIELVQ